MKSLPVIFMSVLIWCNGALNAQSIALKETSVTFGDENYTSWVAQINDMDADFARKSFANFAKDKLDIKVKKHEKSALMGKEVRLTQVYPERRADLVADFQEQGNSVQLALAFVMGYDIILNSQDNPEQMNKFRNLAADIVYDIYQDYYNAQIEDIEQSIQDLEKEMKKNEKAKKKLGKTIQKNTKKMAKSDEVAMAKLEADNIGSQSQVEAADAMNAKLSEELTKLKEDIQKIQEKANKLAQEHTSVKASN